MRETCSLLAPLLQDCRQQAAAAGDRANRLEVEPMAAMHRPIEALTRMSALEGCAVAAQGFRYRARPCRTLLLREDATSLEKSSA